MIMLAEALSTAELFTDGDWIESKDQDPNGDVRLVQLADIGEGRYLDRSSRFLTSETAKALGCTFLRPGDVLVARMPDPLGRACIFPGDEKSAVTAVDVCIIRPDRGRHDPRWLVHYFNSPLGRRQVLRRATGTTRARVSRKNLGQILVPDLPIAEQRQIADVLDRADALRAKRRKAIGRLETLKESIFVEMFGPGSTIMQRWSAAPLGDLLAFMTSGSRGWARYYSTEGELFLRIQNVGEDELLLDDVAYVNAPESAEARRTRVQEGDVVMSITADLGRTAVIPHDLGAAHINQHLVILRAVKVEPRFLSAFLASSSGQRQIGRRNRGASKAGLNFDDVRSFMIPLPPVELQRRFERLVHASETLGSLANRSTVELGKLRLSLQDRVFAGLS